MIWGKKKISGDLKVGAVYPFLLLTLKHYFSHFTEQENGAVSIQGCVPSYTARKLSEQDFNLGPLVSNVSFFPII